MKNIPVIYLFCSEKEFYMEFGTLYSNLSWLSNVRVHDVSGKKKCHISYCCLSNMG